jgi:RNA polymerase sigma-70 factor (ECF subfamily)
MTTDTTITAWDFSSGTLPYYDQLYKTALRMTRSVPDTEDLIQETYLKAYRYYSGFEEGTNLKAWLFRIMKNNFINRYRKLKLEPQKVELDELRDANEDGWTSEPAMGETDQETLLLEGELDQEVQDAILALPHDYKMALLLVDIQGHTYQEVADMLGVPVGTVMSRLYRGRKKIEKALVRYGKRYNYLQRAPRKMRDSDIDVDAIFETAR